MSHPLPKSVRIIERNWLSSNIVVFDNVKSVTVVDTGYDTHSALTESLVETARRDRPLGQIINTHLHSDHCGGNARLARRHACEVVVPAASLERCMRWDREALSFDATGQRCERFSPTGAIEPGQTLELGALRWQVFAAPGHDPDSIVLFEADRRILISADALWQDGFGVIFPELCGQSGFAEQRAMLDLIGRLQPTIVIPGHGPVFDDVGGALERARSRLDFMSRNPERHARYALKVLVRYLMLELEQASREQIMARLLPAALVQSTAVLLTLDTEAAIDQAIDSLIAGGQLTRDEAGTLESKA